MAREQLSEREASAALADIRRLSSGPTLVFDRKHAESQMYERRITKLEVQWVLQKTGIINRDPERTRYNQDYRTTSYAVEGCTRDGRRLRVSVALIEDPPSPECHVYVITAMDR